jgi:putative transposase
MRKIQIMEPRIRTLKYRIYPNESQIERLDRTLGLCMDLYNSALEQRKNAWELDKEKIYKNQQINELPEIKEHHPEYKEVHSQVLQNVFKRLNEAFKAFFRRVKKGENPGYPRFKSFHRYRSITYPQSGFSIRNRRLYVSKIGAIKIKQHRPIFQGVVKTLTIKRVLDDTWYACIAVELPDVSEPAHVPKNPVGLDVGLENMITLSNGETIENPRWFRKTEKKLRRASKALSRKEKWSRNWKRQKKKVAKIHHKIANQRNDFHHKESRKLVDRFDCIVVEDLTMKKMMRDHRLSKSIHDAGWGGLFGKIAYKAEDAGKWSLKVDPQYSTQDCHNCGAVVPKELNDRVHICHVCGIVMARDHNSALITLERGLKTLSKKLGVPLGWRDFKPLEMGTSAMVSKDRNHGKFLSRK